MKDVAVEWPGVSDEARYERVALARIEEAPDAEFAGRVSRQQIAAGVADGRAA